MKENSTDPKLMSSLKAFLRNLLYLYMFALFICLATVTFVLSVTKNKEAEFLTAIVRNSLLAGDNRSAIITLNQSITDEFQSIEYLNSSGSLVFELNTKRQNYSLITPAIRKIVSLEPGSESSSTLVFRYDRTLSIFVALSIWFSGFIMGIPLVRRSRKQILNQHKFELYAQAVRSRNEVAQQVAHDIQSPVAALNAVKSELDGLSTDAKSIVLNSILRIKNITKTLLEVSSSLSEQDADFIYIDQNTVLDAIKTVVNEKIVQHRNIIFLIEMIDQTTTDRFYVLLNPVELSRIISNLIDNSVGASAKNVTIQLGLVDKVMKLIVVDDGNGIPKNVVGTLGDRGNTYGKLGGRGLGLFHAISSCKLWGGSFTIDSNQIPHPTHGTMVTISIPCKVDTYET